MKDRGLEGQALLERLLEGPRDPRAKPYMYEDANQYGFEWPGIPGPEGGARVQVTRLTSINGKRVLLVATEHASIQVAVSPTGREITVYGDVKAVVRG